MDAIQLPDLSIPPKEKPKIENNYRKEKILVACTLFVFAGLIGLGVWFFFFRFETSTDDAYVNGNRLIVNSQVEGSCIAYYADNNQFVEEGDLLVEIDPINYQIALNKSLEELEKVCREVKNRAEKILGLEFDIRAQERSVEKAEYDYKNRSALGDSLAVAKEDIEHNQIALHIEEDKLESLKAQLKAELALLGEGPLEEHPSILVQEEAVRQAYANLMRCKIYAPASGLIALRYVQVGLYITPRTELMSVVPYEEMWVDANFKESQLENIRIGQKTDVTIDQFGSHAPFSGVVQGIQMGTGASFSLLPAQNATGNWIKIVQRVPVRIQLDPKDILKHPLRIGLSAYVKVDTEDRSGEVLQRKGGFSWTRTTSVTDIDFTPIDTKMAKIVQDNLSGRAFNEQP